MKTFKVRVILEVRAESDDDDEVRQAIKDALEEAIEDDTLDYEAEEEEEEL